MKKIAFSLMVGMAMMTYSCKEEPVDHGPEPEPSPNCNVKIEFTHHVNGIPIQLDTIIYENRSNDFYAIQNLQYVISDFRFTTSESKHLTFGEYHYVDIKDGSTFSFNPKDSILTTDYYSISFYLGFLEEDNITGQYPELDGKGMAWPIIGGGGYYGLKMNGRTTSLDPQPYNLAIGSKIRLETSEDTSYVPNEVIGSIPKLDPLEPILRIPKGTKEVTIELKVNVNKLFETWDGVPNYDFQTYPDNLELDMQGSEILSTNVLALFSLGAVTFDAE